MEVLYIDFFACDWLDCRNICVVAFIQCVKQMSSWRSLLLKLHSLSHQHRRDNLISVEYFFKRQGITIVIYWYRLSISLINEAGLFPIWSSIGHSRLRQMPSRIMKWGSSVLILKRCLSVPLDANCMLNSIKVTFLFSNLVKECEMTYCMKKLHNLQ